MNNLIIPKVFIVCFISEMMIMYILNMLDLIGLTSLEEALIDSFLLSIVICTSLAVLGIFDINSKAMPQIELFKNRGFYKKALLLPSILSLVLLSVSLLQLSQFRSVKDDLNDNFFQLIKRKDLLHNIYDSFGYGGFIHNFKNYVIRGEEKYLIQLQLEKDKVLMLLDNYEKMGEGEEGLFHTNLIREVAYRYTQEVKKVKALHKNNMPISQIDELIKIDDTGYIESFNWLKQDLEKKRHKTLAEVNITFDRMATSFILSLIAAISFIFFISFFSNRKLMLSRNEAERLASIKSDFLANMSHEIRTPMNGILGMVQLLNETKLNKNQRDMLETAHFCGDSLLVILNDILVYCSVSIKVSTFWHIKHHKKVLI